MTNTAEKIINNKILKDLKDGFDKKLSKMIDEVWNICRLFNWEDWSERFLKVIKLAVEKSEKNRNHYGFATYLGELRDEFLKESNYIEENIEGKTKKYIKDLELREEQIHIKEKNIEQEQKFLNEQIRNSDKSTFIHLSKLTFFERVFFKKQKNDK